MECNSLQVYKGVYTNCFQDKIQRTRTRSQQLLQTQALSSYTTAKGYRKRCRNMRSRVQNKSLRITLSPSAVESWPRALAVGKVSLTVSIATCKSTHIIHSLLRPEPLDLATLMLEHFCYLSSMITRYIPCIFMCLKVCLRTLELGLRCEESKFLLMISVQRAAI